MAAVEAALAACWHQLHGGNEGGMEPGKLRGRTEDMVWEPPFLRFRVERHGGTALGSSRADLQDWTIDTNEATATVSVGRYRQLHRQEPRLDVRPLAEQLVQLVVDGSDDPRFKRYPHGEIRLLIGEVLPAGSAVLQTLTGRRRRLRAEMSVRLAAAGYEEVGPNRWRPGKDASGPPGA